MPARGGCGGGAAAEQVDEPAAGERKLRTGSTRQPIITVKANRINIIILFTTAVSSSLEYYWLQQSVRLCPPHGVVVIDKKSWAFVLSHSLIFPPESRFNQD